MNPDLDTLVTALYVTVDDLLIKNWWWAPERPVVGIRPQAVRRRVDHLGGDTGTVWDTRPRPVLALRACSSPALVPLSAHPLRL